MSETCKEFRCTRRQPYGKGCPGYTDITSRQGHYIRALSVEDAVGKMRDKFPNDYLGFTVQDWSWGDNHGQVLSGA